MRNLLFKLQYIGTNYHGWQVQKNALAVQEVIQDAVEKITGVRDDVTGCSRLDTGVHANAYYFTVKTNSQIPEKKFINAFNTILSKNMVILDCKEVDESFHPRYNTISKTYLYKIWNNPHRNPFFENLAWYYPYPINADKINSEARSFLGTHDFSSFCSKNAKTQESHVRTIYDIKAEKDGDMLMIKIKGDGFLYNMVRIMVGTLVHMKRGNVTADEILDILIKKDRTFAGKTAPAHGLYLEEVEYR